MANRLKAAADTKRVTPGHGKHGYTRLGVDVAPEQKDRLVDAARARSTSLSAVVRDALDRYLEAA